MIKQYIKQALQMLRENPLVSSISILGTALSIAVIMVILLVLQIKLVGYVPESLRGRMLYVTATQAKANDGNGANNGNMSAEVVKECFYSLQTPEAVTATSLEKRPVSLPEKHLFQEYGIKYTDSGFWKIFDFSFIEGGSFTEADFNSAIPKAVISATVAKDLFGTTKVVGRTIVMNYTSYIICGVVEEVSTAANNAWSDIWVPYTCNSELMNSYCDGIAGPFSIIMLARKESDFEGIRQELKQTTANYNAGKVDYKLNFMECPLTRKDLAIGSTGFRRLSLTDYMLSTGSLLFFLLLIPALNLTGIVQSSVQQRRSEVGLRKAFGATFRTLLVQILSENMVITLIGGILGLGLSFVLLFFCKEFMLQSNTLLTADMLFKPGLFLATLLFVFILNILSAGIPAMRIARQHIVKALKGNE